VTASPAAGVVTYEVVDADGYDGIVAALGELLADAVDSGASVNFLRGFTVADATGYWRARAGEVASGAVRVVVARVDGEVVGVVLLVPSKNPNSPHRAEVAKVLVHRRARRRGIAAGLMDRLEHLARDEGRWLLLLDTQQGSDAERLYRRLGWESWGVVPDHSLTADGRLAPTVFFRKDLREERR
jgi:GNAT superfamily N-acetyltransferase